MEHMAGLQLFSCKECNSNTDELRMPIKAWECNTATITDVVEKLGRYDNSIPGYGKTQSRGVTQQVKEASLEKMDRCRFRSRHFFRLWSGIFRTIRTEDIIEASSNEVCGWNLETKGCDHFSGALLCTPIHSVGDRGADIQANHSCKNDIQMPVENLTSQH